MSQDFLHRVSSGLFFSLRNQCFRVLRDATQLWYKFHNSHSILVVAISSFVGIAAFLWLFVWLFVNLVMRELSLIPGFASRFSFIKLTFGRMPTLTPAFVVHLLLSSPHVQHQVSLILWFSAVKPASYVIARLRGPSREVLQCSLPSRM